MRQRIDTDTWARHAAASNGFADIAATHEFFAGTTPARDTLRGDLQAIAMRVAAAAQATVARLRAWNAQRERRRDAREVYEALRGLDDRTLHDLGFSRSELGSVAAEASGLAEHTRAQTLHTTYGLPG